jgi:hypothetical protein
MVEKRHCLMLRLQLTLIALASALSVIADPFSEAQQSFVRELNSIEGIELAGGPFQISEQHHFEGESGYFVLSPAVAIPTLDQRLTVQTRTIQLSTPSTSTTKTLPVATADYAHDFTLPAAERQQIHILLIQHRFGAPRDEITALDLHTIQIRPVLHLPILKLATIPNSTNPSSLTSNNLPLTTIILLGAQSWQGVPLYRASFDRIRGDFELETLRENFFSSGRHMIARRPPMLAPQTFFAETGLNRDDWRKVLRNFAALDLPALEIIEASLSERLVNLYADAAKPILPQQWVKLERKSDGWRIVQAVEFRAEFPRPGAFWTFLPLLPQPVTPRSDPFPESDIPLATRRELSTIVTRLRGVGKITALSATNQMIHIRTSHDPWRGYDLAFSKRAEHWRLASVNEWTE